VQKVDNIYSFNLMASLDQSDEDAGRIAKVALSDFLARLARKTVLDEQGQGVQRWVYKSDIAIERPGTAAAHSAAGPRFVLIIDQFEEIITSHPDRWQEREEFFQQLNQALLDDPTLWVVLTLREDFVAALDPYAPLLFNRLRARFYMERMGEESALEAVRRPADLGGRPFAAGVAKKLVDELRQVRVPGREETIPGQYVEPVQLQVVCYQLWKRLHEEEVGLPAAGGGAKGTKTISMGDLAVAGNVDQALKEFYIQTLAAVLKEEAVKEVGVIERTLRTWFDKELITDTGSRNTVFRNEASGKTGSIPNVVVNELTERFLLRTVLRGGGAWVELVHDRFVEPILQSNLIWFERNALPKIERFQIEPRVVTQGMNISIGWSVENADIITLEPNHQVLDGLEGHVVLQPEETVSYRLSATRAAGIPVLSSSTPVRVVPQRIEKERIWQAMNDGRFSFVIGPELEKALFSDFDPVLNSSWEPANPLDLEEEQRMFYATRLQRLFLSPQDNENANKSSIHSEDWSSSEYLSALAETIGLTNPTTPIADMLLHMARSPVRFYLTASIHPIIEAALHHVGKESRSATYSRSIDREYIEFFLPPVESFVATIEKPLVFHMFGIDRFPESLLISEDDYLNYLIAVSESRERIPILVRYELANSFKAIIGFDVTDWAFKAFWHGVDVENRIRSPGGLVQVLAKSGKEESDIFRLEAYLARHKYDTVWGTSGDLMNWLHKSWMEGER
jgi:hypothetical protein